MWSNEWRTTSGNRLSPADPFLLARSLPSTKSAYSLTKAELLHKQNAQIKELRRKHEAAQLAVAGAASAEDEDDSQEQSGGGDGEDGGDIETDDGDDGSVAAALRKVCSFLVPRCAGFCRHLNHPRKKCFKYDITVSKRVVGNWYRF